MISKTFDNLSKLSGLLPQPINHEHNHIRAQDIPLFKCDIKCLTNCVKKLGTF